jgi:hypothetical protein
MHCSEMPEYRIGQELTIAIHSKFGKLITALSTAVENGEGSLGKEATSHDDLLDAFRFSMQFWW